METIDQAIARHARMTGERMSDALFEASMFRAKCHEWRPIHAHDLAMFHLCFDACCE